MFPSSVRLLRAPSQKVKLNDQTKGVTLRSALTDMASNEDATTPMESTETTTLVLQTQKRFTGRHFRTGLTVGVSLVLLALACALTVDDSSLRQPILCVPGPTMLCADETAVCHRPRRCHNEHGIPKTIWMMWDKGFDDESAPQFVRRARDSWRAYNPDWEVKALNMNETMTLTGVLDPNSEYYVPWDRFKRMGIQHKADVLRVILLAKFGGLWVDASLQANKPLSEWMDRQREAQFFVRMDTEALRGNPIFSVWFLGVSKNSYVMKKIAAQMIADVNKSGALDYLHLGAKVMKRLWLDDEVFRAQVGPVHDSNPVHCMKGDMVEAPAFKRCARALLPTQFDIDDETRWKETVRHAYIGK